MATTFMLGFADFNSWNFKAVAASVAKYNTIDQREHSFTLIRIPQVHVVAWCCFGVIMYLLSSSLC